MKRSEMVKILSELISVIGEPNKDALVDASKILAVLERYGMKPPKTVRCPVLFNEKHIWERE